LLEATKPVRITFSRHRLSSSRSTLNLGFLTEGKLAATLITPSSWGSQRAGHSPRIRDQVLGLKQDGHGKLEFPWVGPYIVTEVIPGGAYRLQDKKMGQNESNPWNTQQLR
jgi:hypothetical protein